MCHTAPDPVDHGSRIVDISNFMAFLPPSMRNTHSDAYISQLSRLRQSGMLEYWDMGVACLVFERHVQQRLQTSEAEILRDTWAYSLFTLPARFVDVGVLGHWHYFDQKMTDYDISD